jgi:hypothetical protein
MKTELKRLAFNVAIVVAVGVIVVAAGCASPLTQDQCGMIKPSEAKPVGCK